MSHNITVEGGKTVRLTTAGKYCDRDIIITAEGGKEDLDVVLTEQDNLIDELREVLKSKGGGGGGGDELMVAILDGSITEFNSDVTYIGDYAMSYKTALRSVSLPNLTSVGARAFSYSFDLDAQVTLYLPSLVTAGNYAFAYSNMATVIFPKLSEVSKEMFYGAKVRTVDLWAATQIQSNAFFDCYSLATLIIRTSSVCSLASSALAWSVIHDKKGYIYVPRALVDSYKTATNWKTYAAQFRALEDYTVDGTITGELDETKI